MNAINAKLLQADLDMVLEKRRAKMIRSASMAAVALSLVAIECGAASDLVGQIRAVNINKPWGGIMIQLENAPLFEAGSSCQGSWAFVPIGDDYAKHFMAAAMAAKASGETVRIATSGCIATTLGSRPRLEWMDFGLRTGS